jgi:hypothetical protein
VPQEPTEIAGSYRRAAFVRRLSALAACVVAVALGAAVPAGASNHLPRDFFGVVPILELTDADLDRMGAGKVGTVRHLTLWQAIEPVRGAYDWRYMDYLVAGAAEEGISVLPFLYGTPSWVKGIKCKRLSAEECTRVPPLSGKARASWAAFLRAIVARYGSGGSFWTNGSDQYDPPYVPITRWQIWNEPSSQTYYRPKPDPEGYAKLVKFSHDVITGVDPGAEIVLAGVFTAPEGGPRYRIAPYMHDFYGVRGVVKHFDIAAVHPYARTIEGLSKQINNVRRVMRRGRAAAKPLWITELGWSSDAPGPGPLLVGPQAQRDLLAQSFDLLARQREAWNLAGVSWYSWRDPGYAYANCTFCAGSGLIAADGTMKDAWHAFVAATGGTPEPEPEPEPEPPPPSDPFPVLP